MQSKNFRLPGKKIAEFYKRQGMTEFSLFGSGLRENFQPDRGTGLHKMGRIPYEIRPIHSDYEACDAASQPGPMIHTEPE